MNNTSNKIEQQNMEEGTDYRRKTKRDWKITSFEPLQQLWLELLEKLIALVHVSAAWLRHRSMNNRLPLLLFPYCNNGGFCWNCKISRVRQTALEHVLYALILAAHSPSAVPLYVKAQMSKTIDCTRPGRVRSGQWYVRHVTKSTAQITLIPFWKSSSCTLGARGIKAGKSYWWCSQIISFGVSHTYKSLKWL